MLTRAKALKFSPRKRARLFVSLPPPIRRCRPPPPAPPPPLPKPKPRAAARAPPAWSGTCNPAAKAECNDLFEAGVRKVQRPDASVFILDTCEGKTLQRLERIAIPADRIHIAQKDSAEHARMQKECRHRANLHFGLSTDFLRSTSLKFHSVWLDYCGHFEGNAKFQPRTDLALLFQRKCFTEHAFLACTFSWRGAPSHFRYESYAQVLHFITQTARDHGYVAVFDTHRFYGTMFYLSFSIAVVPPPSPSRVHHAIAAWELYRPFACSDVVVDDFML